jgi:hypothetical protein
VTVRGPSGK